jgi:5-methylcytosine-specific restriction protein A
MDSGLRLSGHHLSGGRSEPLIDSRRYRSGTARKERGAPQSPAIVGPMGMPTRALRVCRYPGCPALVDKGYCQAHKHLSPARFNDRARGTASSRGYGPEWRRLRAQVLREEPLCRLCLEEQPKRYTQATHIDHVLCKAHGGTDSRSNLRGLCASHHAGKTAREAAEGRRR